MNEVITKESHPPVFTESKAVNPVTLIQIAIEKGMDIAAMERLFDMQQRWEKLESIKAFNAAFSRFQGDCPTIKKSTNVKFKSQKTGQWTDYWHASREDIENGTKGVLKENGFSYKYEQEINSNAVKVTCILSHSAGHQITSSLSAPPDSSGGKNMLQGIGSTSAYLERYTLAGILGISQTKFDDDGQDYEEPKYYPQESFDKNILIWSAKILDGTATAEKIICKIKKSGSTLTKEQTKTLHGITENLK